MEAYIAHYKKYDPRAGQKVFLKHEVKADWIMYQF